MKSKKDLILEQAIKDGPDFSQEDKDMEAIVEHAERELEKYQDKLQLEEFRQRELLRSTIIR